MKLYVIKNDKGEYMTETRDFINSLWQAELFNDYEVAQCYCPIMTLCDCQIVEVEIMETTELAEHDKQMRKKVCEEIIQELLKIEDTLINLGKWERR